MKVLIVDDDLTLSDIVSFAMRRAGYAVYTAHDGQAAIERWKAEAPDLILLDLNLPKLDGLGVCRHIRGQDDVPIIILSVRGEEDDVVKGLKLGADDYIVKPFSPRQLVARAEAVLRRAKSTLPGPSPLQQGDLRLDPARNTVYYKDAELAQLTRLECRLLETLMLHKGQVLTSESLIDEVWGPAGGDRTMLKQLIYRLRKKIEPDPAHPTYLMTVSGVGYSLEA